jgi:hypothetical protein
MNLKEQMMTECQKKNSKKSKMQQNPSFLWYLIIVKLLKIPTPYQVFRYEMPDDNLTIKELRRWYKEDNK